MSISLGSVLQQGQKSGAASTSRLAQASSTAEKPQAKVTLTERGAKQALVIFAKTGEDPATTWLRLGVQGGGCSGLSYLVDLSKKKDALDVEFEQHGVRMLVDRKSLIYLANTELDWVTGLKGHGWQFKNPNTKKSCSCGESFTL